MGAIRKTGEKYKMEDITNMDKTGLYWRKALDEKLSTHPTMGLEKNKSRIFLVFCTNSTETDQMPLCEDLKPGELGMPQQLFDRPYKAKQA